VIVSNANSLPSRRDFLKLSGGASLGLVVAACAPGSGSKSSGGGKGTKGKTITIGMEAGSPFEAFYKAAAPRFTQATGIKVKFLGVPHDNMHQQFLSDALSGSGAYDVYEADQPWVPEFASKKFLVSLDDSISAADRADFAGSTLDTVSYQGKLYALPFLVHNTVLYYRTDLFDNAGISAPPVTWAEYRAYAKKLTDRKSGIYGTLVEGKQEGEVAVRFQSFIHQAGSDIADSNFKPTIDTVQARMAAHLMTALAFEDKSTPSGLLNLTDMQGLFLQGKLAMAPVWPYLYSLAKDPKQSKVAGKFDVALSPGNPDQVSTTFSWGFAVSAASKNRDAAWEWVKWATSTQLQTEFGKNQVNPVPRKSAVAKIFADKSVSAADRKAIATFAKSAGISKTIPMTPLYPQWQDAMAVAVSSIMSRSQTPEAALRAAQVKMSQASSR
jgi:ABC-type glycerol-3-phosphate transport system substrate-binding protein